MMRFSKSIRWFGAGLVLAALAGAPATAGETVGQYIDDATITTKIKAALAADKLVKARDINVKTYKGVVQLNGFVESPREVTKAAQDAQEVEGVKELHNNLTVKQ